MVPQYVTIEGRCAGFAASESIGLVGTLCEACAGDTVAVPGQLDLDVGITVMGDPDSRQEKLLVAPSIPQVCLKLKADPGRACLQLAMNTAVTACMSSATRCAAFLRRYGPPSR